MFNLKYVVLLYDGMSDYPVPALDGKTPMEAAKKPIFDSLAKKSEVGLVKTIPDGVSPGSDVANLSVLGYDPRVYHKGRSPLEAANLGIVMAPDDVALRCNLVTLSDDKSYDDKTMLDYSAGDIGSDEAAEIIRSVEEHFGSDRHAFYSGVSYRHCLIVHGGTTDLGSMTPPHDISNRVVGPYISQHENAAELVRMMRESYEFLKDHRINKKRIARGKLPANSIWLWGEGTYTELPSFKSFFGVNASIISAVDLLNGIGFLTGMNTPRVPGATGYIDTNFRGKALTAINEMKGGQDFVYLHFEAPDECGHRNEPENKVRSIELIDELVLPPLLDYLRSQGRFRLMILPDHPTPIVTGTHATDPVPYMIYDSADERVGVETINERTAAATGSFIDVGHEIMKRFLRAE